MIWRQQNKDKKLVGLVQQRLCYFEPKIENEVKRWIVAKFSSENFLESYFRHKHLFHFYLPGQSANGFWLTLKYHKSPKPKWILEIQKYKCCKTDLCIHHIDLIEKTRWFISYCEILLPFWSVSFAIKPTVAYSSWKSCKNWENSAYDTFLL